MDYGKYLSYREQEYGAKKIWPTLSTSRLQIKALGLKSNPALQTPTRVNIHQASKKGVTFTDTTQTRTENYRFPGSHAGRLPTILLAQ